MAPHEHVPGIKAVRHLTGIVARVSQPETERGLKEREVKRGYLIGKRHCLSHVLLGSCRRVADSNEEAIGGRGSYSDSQPVPGMAEEERRGAIEATVTEDMATSPCLEVATERKLGGGGGGVRGMAAVVSLQKTHKLLPHEVI